MWIGMKSDGKFVVIMFYRQLKKFIIFKVKGRGYFVLDFLKGDDDVENYFKKVSNEGDFYNGFNFLVGELLLNGEIKVGWYCNIEDK